MQTKTKQLKRNFFHKWEPMGFRKLQAKKMWRNFHDEIGTWKHWYIIYELSSFFLNLSTGEWEQNGESEKIESKSNDYHS